MLRKAFDHTDFVSLAIDGSAKNSEAVVAIVAVHAKAPVEPAAATAKPGKGRERGRPR